MTITVTIALFLLVLIATTVTVFVMLLRRISDSVGLAPPTAKQWQEENPAQSCALFRQLPQLAERIAFRSLGVNHKTPVHLGRFDTDNSADQSLSFLIKREDLILHDYGGNKIRTLQHQLAICEARRDRGEKAFLRLLSIGSGGSNQAVATTVHARKLGYDGQAGGNINTLWFEDAPDLDNTLNMLSVLSFSNVGFTHDWGNPTGGVRGLLGALRAAWTQRDIVPMMPGGNCPAGVLGQAGGLLELAEQIADGVSPDVERIYVPIGSGCTVSGLIVGSVLARHLGIPALQSDSFQIIACNVHQGAAKGDRLIRFHVNPWFSLMPLTITHSVLSACRALRELGGPDLTEQAKAFIKYHVDLRTREDVIGKYGTHSDISRQLAKQFDLKGSVTNLTTGNQEKELWICGHFVAKALQPLLEDLKSQIQNQPNYMLWMTKSAIQPRGELNEWSRFQERSSAEVRQWADEGQAQSHYRPGHVSTTHGTPEDYRCVMKKIVE